MANLPGLEFAPIEIPWERRLQTLGVLHHIWVFFFTPAFIVFLFFFLLLTGQVFTLAAYGLWLWWDWNSHYRGAYASRYFLNLRIHKWFTSYFPLSIHPTAELPNDQNYLIGFHPHGIISISAYNFMSNATGLMDRFPSISFHLCTLVNQFYIPLRREWMLLHGVINCSKEAIKYVLGDSRKGQAAVLVVGGAEESLDSHPGKYELTLSRRKGFIKIALETGAHLVPCFGFGETDLYVQAANRRGSWLRRFQEWAKQFIGMPPAVFLGRGVFNYNFGLLPYRKELNTVLGAPIPVVKTEKPSQEQIDELHALYIKKLTELFDEHKTKYGVPEDLKLVIH